MALRKARVRAYAKINLSLKVLGKREDGFHELRTVFQTISLADELSLEYEAGGAARVEVADPMGLGEQNLVHRAARAVMEAGGIGGRVRIGLKKRVPSGAGLGGGSSDAAAVLLALPALAGRKMELAELMEVGGGLGSDVAFFLAGGTALGIGRGEELYPLPDERPWPVMVVAPPIHVATPEAYRMLGRGTLTSGVEPPKLNTFQSFVWQSFSVDDAENDFEVAVFRLYPELERWLRKLERSGARVARLSGSGAALFGVFPNQAKLQGALPRFRREPLTVFSTRMLTRGMYRARWSRSLREHAVEGTWPPRSRH